MPEPATHAYTYRCPCSPCSPRPNPSLRGILFETPAVAEGGRARLGSFAERCEVVAGDFLEQVPAGADAYLLCRVLRSLDDAGAGAVLRNCAAAMEPGARLLGGGTARGRRRERTDAPRGPQHAGAHRRTRPHPGGAHRAAGRRRSASGVGGADHIGDERDRGEAGRRCGLSGRAAPACRRRAGIGALVVLPQRATFGRCCAVWQHPRASSAHRTATRGGGNMRATPD